MGKLSHQRIYQLKNKKLGLCIECGKNAWRKGSAWCQSHREMHHTNQFDLLKTLDKQLWDNFYNSLVQKELSITNYLQMSI